MGTLGNQPERNFYRGDLDSFLGGLKEIAAKYKVSIEAVIEAKKVLEMERRNDLYAANGDYFDEQMGGFGDRLSEIASAIGDRGS